MVFKNKNLEYYTEEKVLNPPLHVLEELNFIFNFLPKKKNLKLVDFGAGGGRVTIPLLKKGYQVLAVDIDKNALRRLIKTAKKIKKEKYLKIKSSLPKKEKYDVILGADVLYHIDIKKYFPYFYNHLKRRGKIIFSEPNVFNFSWIVFISLFLNWFEEKGIFQINYFYLIHQLKKSGFKKIKIFGLYFFPPMIFGKNNFLQKINLFLGNLPLLKLFAFRCVIVGEK
jgi:2-polyprenyl-3-methyl-5-hydroxy-6-metoxy-1,4-benzoquinol methylase